MSEPILTTAVTLPPPSFTRLPFPFPSLGPGSYLHLEGVLLAPLALREGVAQRVGAQHRLHDAIDVDLVARDQRVTVRGGLLPLDSYVAEVASSGDQIQTV